MKQALLKQVSTSTIPLGINPTAAMAYSARTASAEVLTTLAVLKVHEEQGQDYLQNFMPFVAECIHAEAGSVVTATTLQTGFKRLFGFEVPVGVMQTLLRRASRQGLVRQENRLYRPVREKLAALSIEQDRELAGAELEQLTLAFQTFALDEFAKPLSPAEAETALFGFIAEHGVFSLLDARHSSSGMTATENSTHFLVGAFVEHLHSTHAEGLSYFERAVQGSMLASMLHFEKKVTVHERWQSAKVYFDTPILLRLLGLYGEEVRAPYVELVNLLNTQGVPIHCFHNTLSELDRILYATEEALRRGRREAQFIEELGEVLLAADKTWTDIKLERGRVEQKLLALGITLHEYPRMLAHLTPDMSKVEEVFQKAVGYRKENARTHDVECVLAVGRMRNGTRPTQIERSIALFVTTNQKVVRAAREVYRTEFGYQNQDVNVCISADVLTTIAWLKTNAMLGAQGTLPRKQLIADAYAAMKPTPDLWAAYMKEIQKLRADEFLSENDVLYLRCAPEAIAALTRTTLNNPAMYAEGTVEQVLEQARAANRRDAEAAHLHAEGEREAAEALLAQREGHILEIEQQTAQETLARVSAEAVLSQQQVDLVRQQQQLAAIEAWRAGRRRVARGAGALAGWAAFVLVFGLLSSITWNFGLASSVPPALQVLQKAITFHNFPVLSLGSFSVFVVLSLLGLVPLAQQARGMFAARVERWVQQLLLDTLAD